MSINMIFYPNINDYENCLKFVMIKFVLSIDYLFVCIKITVHYCIAIFYVATSVKTLSSLTSRTTFPASTSSIINPSLSDSIATPTPTVPSGILNTINEMKPFIDEYIYRFMFST